MSQFGKTDVSRRTALKRIGTGVSATALGVSGLFSATERASAAQYVVDSYPFEIHWDDSRTAQYNAKAEDQSFCHGIRFEDIHSEGNEATIGINIEHETACRDSDDGSKLHDIIDQRVGVEGREAELHDVTHRQDDDWAARHEYSGNGEHHDFYSTAVEQFAQYAIDQLNNTVGSGVAVAMDTYDFLADGYEAFVDHQDQKGYSWSYNPGSGAYYGKADAGAEGHLRAYPDKDDAVELTVYGESEFAHTGNKRYEQSFLLKHPDTTCEYC